MSGRPPPPLTDTSSEPQTKIPKPTGAEVHEGNCWRYVMSPFDQTCQNHATSGGSSPRRRVCRGEVPTAKTIKQRWRRAKDRAGIPQGWRHLGQRLYGEECMAKADGFAIASSTSRRPKRPS
uniref:Uncharacterized protein n=1 Tax=Oryza glaberrima TaxID=4538 RepID=I1NNA7_ORYGL